MKRAAERRHREESLRRHHKQIPRRPKKTLFKLRKPGDIERRKSQLEAYCKLLLERNDLLQDETLQGFLEIEDHVPELVVSTRPRLGAIEKPHLLLPLTHLLWDNQATLLVTVESLLAEDSSKPKPSAGKSLLKLFDMVHPLPSDKPFEALLRWTLKCPNAIASVGYCPSLRIICWGTDAGLLFIQKLMATNDIIDSTAGLRVHDGRLTDICVEETQEYIITIGSDKKIVGTSMSGKGLFCAKLGDHPLRKLLLDPESRSLLVSNVRGQVFVCDIQCVKVNVLQRVSNIESSELLAVSDCLTSRLYVWYAEDGVLRWGQLDELSESKTAGAKKLQGDATAITYLESKGVIVVANCWGQLKFVDLATGSLKLTLQCHQAPITSLHVDPATGVILTASQDASIAVHNWPLD